MDARKHRVHPEQVKALKAMSPARKLELAAAFWHSARELKAAWLRKRHPDWSEKDVWDEVKRQFLYAR